MKPLSEENAAIMPSVADLAKAFGIKPKAHGEEVPTPEQEPEVPEEEPAQLDEVPEQETPVADEEPPVEEDEVPEEEPAPEAPKEEPVQKRINQLTAQKSELQKQLDETKAQLARAQSQPTANDPLAHVNTVAELNDEVAQAKQVRAMAMKNRFGMTVKGTDGNDVTYSEEDMANMLLSAEDTIELASVKREQLAGMEADEQALLAAAPHLAQSEHPHTAYVAQVLAHNGTQIRQIAALAKMSPRRIAYALALGLNQLSQPKQPAASPATRPAQQPKKAPPIPTPRTATRAPAKDVHARQAQREPIAGGKPRAVERRIEATLAY